MLPVLIVNRARINSLHSEIAFLRAEADSLRRRLGPTRARNEYLENKVRVQAQIIADLKNDLVKANVSLERIAD